MQRIKEATGHSVTYYGGEGDLHNLPKQINGIHVKLASGVSKRSISNRKRSMSASS